MTTGVWVAVDVVVAFMVALPRAVVPPLPTRTVRELDVVVTTVWFPDVVAVALRAAVVDTRTEELPFARVIVVLYVI